VYMGTDSFDGLRYFVPMIPLLYFVFLFFLAQIKKPLQARYVCLVVALNLFSALLFVYPFRSAHFMHDHRGFIGAFPLYMEKVDLSLVLSSPMREIFLPWVGLRTFHRDGISKALQGTPANLSEVEQKKFWAGVGMGQEIDPACLESRAMNCLTSNHKEERHALLSGWLLASPCSSLNQSLRHWHSRLPDPWPLLEQRPDWDMCRRQIDRNLLDGKKFSSSLFPLSVFWPDFSGEKMDYTRYAGLRLYVFLHSQPGSFQWRPWQNLEALLARFRSY